MSKSNVNVRITAIKLSDLQRAWLSAATQREDCCLTRPASQRSAQIAKPGDRLMAAGYAREVKAKDSLPIWRQDGKTGAAFALKMTTAGIKAIGVERVANASNEARTGEGSTNGRDATRPPRHATTPELAREKPARAKPSISAAGASAMPSPAAKQAAPRPNSKIAAVIELLSRTGGATLSELIAATDWLPHTTRAALSGLRKRGYGLFLDRTDRQRGSVYQMTSQPDCDGLISRERAAEAA